MKLQDLLPLILRYEMGMSRAITRRGYNIAALNLLQRGVDWRKRDNADGCRHVTSTCYYSDYRYGPPDLMFTKLSANDYDNRSTYEMLAPMYNNTHRKSRQFQQRWGFTPEIAGDSVFATEFPPWMSTGDVSNYVVIFGLALFVALLLLLRDIRRRQHCS